MQVGRMIGRDLFGGRKRGLGRIEQHLLDMLDADRHTLELATTGLLGSADPEALHHEVSDSDHRVNLLVQRVRRELVVHASLRGTHADISAMFATMSVVKDIERVGDYAKHLLRIARIRGPFVPDSAEHVELAAYSNRIARTQPMCVTRSVYRIPTGPPHSSLTSGPSPTTSTPQSTSYSPLIHGSAMGPPKRWPTTISLVLPPT